MPDKKLLYIGQDKNYWETIQSKITEAYPNLEKAEFVGIHEEYKGKYSSLFQQVLTHHPQIIYLDLSVDESLFQLASALRQSNLTRHIILIVLVGHLTKQELINRCIANDILIIQIKMGEDLHDVIYDAIALAFPGEEKEPDFFHARFSDGEEMFLQELFRISYFSADHMQLECNYPVEPNSDIRLKVQIPENILPSAQFTITSVEKYSTYYRKLFRIKAKYLYLDKIIEPRKMDNVKKVEIAEEKKKREEEIKTNIKPAFDEWFSQQDPNKVSPKLTKLLVIDRNLNIWNQTDRWVGEYSFAIRLQTNFLDAKEDLEIYQPMLIAIQYDELPAELEEGDSPENYNSIDSIKKLVAGIRTIKNYMPFLFIFNIPSSFNSAKLQQELKYQRIIAHNASFCFKTVSSVATMYDEKLKAKSKNNGLVYVDKLDPFSYAAFDIRIDLMDITEHHLYFSCKKELQMFGTYFMTNPSNFYITLVPITRASQYFGRKECYRGLIHSISVNDKKKLRQFLNAKKKGR